LVHQSAKDYLLNNEADIKTKFHVRDLQSMHEKTATRLMEEIENGCVEDAGDYPHWPLSWRLEWPLGLYAVRNWDYHFLQVSDYEAFMQSHEDFFSERSALREKWYVCRDGVHHDNDPSLLGIACEFGWEGPTRRLLQLRTEQFGSREVEDYVNQCFGFVRSTPLEVALEIGPLSMVKLLLEYGADPARSQSSFYHFCTRLDDPTMFTQIVASGGARELLEAEGAEVLSIAAAHRNANICRLLIETYGVPVDVESGSQGGTALLTALTFGNMELAHMFVNEWHASTDDHFQLLGSIIGQFVLSGCVAHPAFRNLHHIIEQWGVNVNASDPISGEGLVHQRTKVQEYLVSALSPEDLEFLVLLGLDLAAQDHRGNTVLHTMHDLPDRVNLDRTVDMDVLRLLLQYECLNVDAVNFDGQTALNLLVSSLSTNKNAHGELEIHSQGSWQMAKNLLDLGADRNLKNKKGKSALDLAYEGVESERESDSSSGSTNPLSLSLTSGEMRYKCRMEMRYKYRMELFDVLSTYKTVPLLSPTSQKVEAETANFQHEESNIQTLDVGAIRSG
jgi:ankyrin repeat protein